MYCGKCGTEITENGKFCPKCGAAVSAEQISEMPKTSAEQTENLSNATVPRLNEKKDTEIKACKLEDKHIKQLSSYFVSQDEKFIASLGNGYIINYLVNKSTSRGYAFITDKRIYFKGTCLAGSGKKLTKSNEERTVDIKNITGSGFIYHEPIGLKIAAFISFAMVFVSILASVLYNIFR
ncbi:MAG: zinc ribbon domain-containing protein [Lachnospiraceae bacterium]|nr:zinc ribbon domain-containing protein [Lachnospiraceae bacterium]